MSDASQDCPRAWGGLQCQGNAVAAEAIIEQALTGARVGIVADIGGAFNERLTTPPEIGDL